jgi:hypothetical protein
MLIKKITKLFLLYQKLLTLDEEYSIEDCYNLLEFNFEKIDDTKINELQNKILNNIKKEKNNFFYENKGSDSWKMIMSLISSDLSNTPIFLQGAPGSGKTCAAKYYGANRKFNGKDPIIFINCYKDLTFDYLIGNYRYRNSKFEFVDGPLINAIKNGETILLDEFNLCSDDVLNNLLPILKANINDQIYLKNYPKPIKVNNGFLLIATGNFQHELGRKKIPSFIMNEMNKIEIQKNNLDINLIKEILNKEYKDIKQEDNSYDRFKISSKQIKEIYESIDKITDIKISLRQIKCLLNRIQRFCVETITIKCEGLNKNLFIFFEQIPVIYIIISYIIPRKYF